MFQVGEQRMLCLVGVVVVDETTEGFPQAHVWEVKRGLTDDDDDIPEIFVSARRKGEQFEDLGFPGRWSVDFNVTLRVGPIDVAMFVATRVA